MSSTSFEKDPARMRAVRRLHRASAIVAGACLVIPALLALGLGLYWFGVEASRIAAQAGLPAGAVSGDWATRTGGFVLSGLPLLALGWGLAQVRRSFLAVASGQTFSPALVRGLRNFSASLFVSAAIKPVADALLSLFLTRTAGQGERMLALNIGSDTLLILLFAGILWAITWILAEAVDLADDLAQIV